MMKQKRYNKKILIIFIATLFIGTSVVTAVNLRVDKNTYFRLRGTNLAPNTAFETDPDGNPLVDSEQKRLDGVLEAWADLWFYSNPIFVYVE